MKKRIFSLLIALCLVAGMLPTATFATGSTPDPTPISVTVNNCTNGTATVDAPDQWYEGANRFSVISKLPCVAIVEHSNGTDEILECGEIDAATGHYRFFINAADGDTISIAVKGDVNLDGIVTNVIYDYKVDTEGNRWNTYTLYTLNADGTRTSVVEPNDIWSDDYKDVAKLSAHISEPGANILNTLPRYAADINYDGQVDQSDVDILKSYISNSDTSVSWDVQYDCYTITFDTGDGGSTVSEQKVLEDETATEPAAPTRAGYSFEGWYNCDDPYDFSTPVTENITLTAKWTASRIELTKEILDSTYKVESAGIYIYRLPSGNYYLGENISVDIRIEIGNYQTQTQNVVLDLNGYELKKDNSGTLLHLNYSSTLTLTDSSLTKTGKVIGNLGNAIELGRNSKLNANGGTVEGVVGLNGDNAVIDNTDPLNVTIFRDGQIAGFNTSAVINGGIFYSTVGTVYEYKGQITGGTFYGAVTNDWGITGGTFYGPITGSGTVSGVTYRRIVTFDSNDGSEVPSQDILKDSTATEPTAPTKAGYDFVGWYNGDAIYDFSTPVTEAITLSAKWTPKTYHVTLNTNGADSCAELTTYTYGVGATLPTPVKAGYAFAGWYAANDFSGDAVTSIRTTDTDDKMFYAKWVEKSDISFNTNPQSYTYDGSAQAFSITGTAVTGFNITYQQNGQTVTNPTNAGSYNVIITRAEDDTYKAVDVTINNGLVINPATPTENPAKKTTARVIKGKTLADATVTNGEIFGVDGTTVLTGTFAWVDSAKVMSADGTEQMVFTPESANYTPITIDAAVSTYSSGGGSSTPTYAPTVTQPENGTVTVSPKSPRKGDTVTITPTPDAGYTVEQVLVTDKNGDAVEVINNGDGTYSFTQPAGKVNINVTFMEDNSMLNFFVDVFPGDYYYDAVLWAAENGITGGVDDTHFAPNAPCTRAQIVTFLWRAAGSPEPESLTSLSDVPADAYYAKAVAWALENGITTGTGDGTTFSPNATCTRAQAMAFIYRSEQARGGGMQGTWMFLNPFSDVDLESYYGEAVMWAVANGVTDGTTATTFSPNATCTRAQIVTFLFRCLGGE